MLLFHHLAREGASPETIPEAERRRGRCRRTGIRPFGPGPGNRERLGRRPRAGGGRDPRGGGAQNPPGVFCRKAGGREKETPPGGRRGAPSRLASGKDTP